MDSYQRERIGVISDTHGLLRPEALSFLNGCNRILHAGDIGDAFVIRQLETIAPVIAVRGNNDTGEWAGRFQQTELIQLGAHWCYMIHDRNEMDIDVRASGVDIVITG